MKKEDLIDKTTQLIDAACEDMKKNVIRAIDSGSMNIEEAEDNWILPKLLFKALIKEEDFQTKVPSYIEKKMRNVISKIYAML